MWFKPTSAEALRKKGSELIVQGNYRRALTHLERAILLDPGDLSTYNDKALALLGLVRNEEALACCDEILARDPDNRMAKTTKSSTVWHSQNGL